MQNIKYFWILAKRSEGEVSKPAKVVCDLKYSPFLKLVP